MEYRTVFSKIVYIAVLTVLCICMTGCEQNIFKNIQAAIDTGSYQGIYLYDEGTLEITKDDFSLYRGLNVYTLKYTGASFEDLTEYIELIGNSSNALTECYITIDPYDLWNSCKRDADCFVKTLERFTEAVEKGIKKNSTIYEITFPAKSIDYWGSLDGDSFKEACASYCTFAEKLIGIENVFLYGYALEEWLYLNTSNYKDGLKGGLLDSVNLKMYMSAFCDRVYVCESLEAFEALFEVLRENVDEVKNDGFFKADTGGATVIALGDSIFGNYIDTTSVAAVVANFSDATVYNCGIGGIDASIDPDYYDFNDLIDIVLGNMSYESKDGRTDFKDVSQELNRRLSMNSDAFDDKLVFIVEFGLNDYFNKCLVKDYKEALIQGICRLSEKFPDAEILIAAPGRIGIYEYGNTPQNSIGETLEDFRNACAEVASLCNCSLIELTDVEKITDESIWKYTEDGVHFNPAGRYYVGRKLADALKTD